ncbi:NADPH-dependent F420 reductase [Sorangium sp. So ce341]|uniref:NADPH-dependent F420 reductase n=1 Tax=Sorangium sp. So ce341 TaxID=3133302 RepID=UPI003F6123B1
MSSIGIIGAGEIGGAIARQLARLHIAATLSNSRGPESLRELVATLGPTITAGTREEAASKDIVFVSVGWLRLPAALGGLPDFGGRIVVDTNNPMQRPPLPPIDVGGRASSSIVAEMVPGARLVKAFNHHFERNMAAHPARDGGRRVLFYAGDDVAAKATVGALIERLGFFGVDMGDIEVGSRTFQAPGGPLIAHNFVRTDP